MWLVSAVLDSTAKLTAGLGLAGAWSGQVLTLSLLGPLHHPGECPQAYLSHLHTAPRVASSDWRQDRTL